MAKKLNEDTFVMLELTAESMAIIKTALTYFSDVVREDKTAHDEVVKIADSCDKLVRQFDSQLNAQTDNAKVGMLF